MHLRHVEKEFEKYIEETETTLKMIRPYMEKTIDKIKHVVKEEDKVVKAVERMREGHSKFFSDLFLKDTSQVDFKLDGLLLSDFKIFYQYILEGDSFEIVGDNILALMATYKHYNVLDIENKVKTWIMDEKNITYLGIAYENSIDTKLQVLNDSAKMMVNQNYAVIKS
uniref:BTB domain-containing protein n=1 Tax=Rhabditophanes sp. KR3021 TaxID=114890 RepID=A0AC35TG88_9BILA